MTKRIWIYTASVTLTAFLLLEPFSIRLWNGVVNAIDPLFYAWNLHFNAEGARISGSIFDTNIFYPLTNTIAYSDTMWGLWPFASPIIWLLHNPILAENALVLLSFPLSALSMFFLTHYLTRHEPASYLAGILYAFLYPRIAQIGHLPFLSNEWIPLVILFAIQFFDNGSFRHLLSAFLFFILSVSSSVYLGFMVSPMLLVITLVYFMSWIYSKDYKLLLSRLKLFLLCAIPFLIISLAANSPYIRLAVEYPQYKRTLFDTMELRAFPRDFLSVTSGSLLHKLGLPASTAEHALYPTVTLLVLSLYGLSLIRKRNKKTFIICAASFVCYLVLSFGAELTMFGYTVQMPYKFLFNSSVIFQTLRVPARFGIFAFISLIIPSAFALKHIALSKSGNVKILAFLCLFLLEIWQLHTPYVPVPVGNAIPGVYKWLKQQPDSTVVAELPIRLFYQGSNMADQLMKEYDNLDKMDNYALETYRIYFSTHHNKRMVNGYSGFFPESYNKLSASLQNFPDEGSFNTLKDYGVTTIILHGKEFGDDFASMEASLAQRKDLQFVQQFGDDVVYEIIQ